MAFSFFMRDQPTLEHAVEQMIPYAGGRSRIRVWVWDAGCALGLETYNLAMILAERMNRFGFKNTQRLPDEVADLLSRVIPAAQIYKKRRTERMTIRRWSNTETCLRGITSRKGRMTSCSRP